MQTTKYTQARVDSPSPSSNNSTPLGSPTKANFLLSDDAVTAEHEDRTTFFVAFLTVAAALSGLLFGWDTGVISGVLVQIGSGLGRPVSSSFNIMLVARLTMNASRQLTTIDKEWVTSILTVGALFGALVAGVLSDRIGRKAVLAGTDFFFILGAVVQAASFNLPAFYAGRFLMGLGVGSAAGIVPLYIGELAPTKQRGALTTINVVAITLGQVLAYAVGAGFAHVNSGWRYLVAFGAGPAVLQLAVMHYLPESPRYLLRTGQPERAQAVLERIYPYASEKQLSLKIKVIDQAVGIAREAERAPWRMRFSRMFSIGRNRRALIIACGLQALQQLSGFNSLMYYSATIFSLIGFTNPTAVGLIVSGTNFAFTCLAMQIIECVEQVQILYGDTQSSWKSIVGLDGGESC